MASAAFPELAEHGSWTGDNSSIYSLADQQVPPPGHSKSAHQLTQNSLG